MRIVIFTWMSNKVFYEYSCGYEDRGKLWDKGSNTHGKGGGNKAWNQIVG